MNYEWCLFIICSCKEKGKPCLLVYGSCVVGMTLVTFSPGANALTRVGCRLGPTLRSKQSPPFLAHRMQDTAVLLSSRP